MPENTQPKEMKLIFAQTSPTSYTKTITDMQGNLMIPVEDNLLQDDMGAEYFDAWIEQMETMAWANIVEVQRFR